MRHLSLSAATCALLIGSTCAQTPANNRHLYFPDAAWASINAATRLGAAYNADVECLVDFAAQNSRGLGAKDNTTCEMTGQIFVLQDQEKSTIDNYKLVYRNATSANGPADTSLAGIIAQSNSIALPAPTPGTGAIAWVITVAWTTPIVVPCENGLYAGVELLPGASASDYTLIQTANAYGTALGDNPRISPPKFFAASIALPAGTFTRSSIQRTLAFNLMTTQATLNVGNIDASQANYKSYGLGGTYPAIKLGARDDGLTVRVQDDNNSGGIGGLDLSTGYLPGGFSIGTIAGALWLNPAVLVSLGGISLPAIAPGVVETTVAAPGSIPAAVGVTLTFQAVTSNLLFTTPHLSNAQATSL